MDDERSTTERRCSAPGCKTTLSKYNSDHLCFVHADAVSRLRFERVTGQSRRVVYRPSPEPQVARRSG
jgi:hypothetical protein